MGEQSIFLNPNWRDRIPTAADAATDLDATFDRVHACVLGRSESGGSPGERLGAAAEEIARVLVVHGPEAVAPFSALCRHQLVEAAARDAELPDASAATLLGVLAYQQTQIVSDATRSEPASRDLLDTERRWLEALAVRTSALDRFDARRALVMAVAARTFELVPRFVRLRNTATVLVEKPDDPDTYLRLIATFPDTPLTWIELLYIARAYRQHAVGGGIVAVASTATWLHRAVRDRQWPAPPASHPPPPPLWTRPAVQRAIHLFAPRGSTPEPATRWSSIEYWGLHGLWGGSAIRIHSDGNVVAERGRPSRRYHAVMSTAGLAELDQVLAATNLSNIPSSSRPPVPDEIGFELALETADDRVVVRRWSGDAHAEFDPLRQWLTEAADAVIAAHAPSGSSALGDWKRPSQVVRSPRESALPHGGFVALKLADVLPLHEWLADPPSASPPSRRTRLRVFSHIAPAATPLKCMSFITDGLRDVGRDEMILTVPEAVLIGGAEDAPAEILSRIATDSERAPRLEPGALMALRRAPATVWQRVTGFAAERAHPMDDVDLPAGCLSVHALIGAETEAALSFGPLRVLARLGKAFRFYPTPSWSDPRRDPLAAPDEDTVLARVTTVHFPGVTVTRERSWLVVRIARSSQPRFAEELRPESIQAPLALLTSLHPHADGCLFWRPGQAVPEANTPPASAASRLAGCFVLFSPNRPTDGGQILEDGFVMSLSPASARRVGEALKRGLALELPATRPNASGLRLEWTGELA